ncbi:TPA: hypothetical protein DIC20_05615 [Candidatus Dependentiae bacterium]|nr:MAG: hypothetical protein US03_C0010G0046 [candidate division TM6 bacterium GW2011_GWF2_36_131]KKQ02769.1 MAG: hypothetical protein US13_C0010G0029 [candidate division TM6 bacterium GW2011_GWE2_36_25]KKQ19133.1 MAG: hypothetical protein US32_C0015G0016 [candidate division TM6 bacterium GW2011_GWA2_36_9]HBR70421.1 hypothetical protein [Candidatus Dependentiae bacterium]HCU01142.1 hypothetical protein [Candidatus Dependentiae bacterium]
MIFWRNLLTLFKNQNCFKKIFFLFCNADLSFREKASSWSSLSRFIVDKGIKDTGLAVELILLLPKVTSSFDQRDSWNLISCLVMRAELVKLLDSISSDQLSKMKEVIENFFSLFRSFPREIRAPIYL